MPRSCGYAWRRPRTTVAAADRHTHISGWLTVEFTEPSRPLRPLVRFYPANVLEAC